MDRTDTFYTDCTDFLLALIEVQDWQYDILQLEIQAKMQGASGYCVSNSKSKIYLRTKLTELFT